MSCCEHDRHGLRVQSFEQNALWVWKSSLDGGGCDGLEVIWGLRMKAIILVLLVLLVLLLLPDGTAQDCCWEGDVALWCSVMLGSRLGGEKGVSS